MKELIIIALTKNSLIAEVIFSILICIYFTTTSESSFTTISYKTIFNDNNTSYNSNKYNNSIRQPFFLPFSHNVIALKNNNRCKWITRDYLTTLSSSSSTSKKKRDLIVQKLLGHDIDSPDKVQITTLSEGFCLSKNTGKYHHIHLFSTDEARSCLKDKTLVITGDSYTKQLFIGLCDIILDNPSNRELVNFKVRSQLDVSYIKLLNDFQNNNTELGLDINHVCIDPCYGYMSFAANCSNCLNNFFDKRKEKVSNSNINEKAIIPVVGAMTHAFNTKKRQYLEKGTKNKTQRIVIKKKIQEIAILVKRM